MPDPAGDAAPPDTDGTELDIDLVRSIAASCTDAGEAPPFSDQTVVDLRGGRARVLRAPGDRGVAVVRSGELELAVVREARGAGTGAALVAQALALPDPPTLAWAHGDHAAARAIADRHGWQAVRTLLQLRAPLPASSAGGTGPDDATAPAPSLPDGMRIDGMRTAADASGPDAAGGGAASADEAAWLELNALAFAHHPEQGGMTLEDLRAREQDDWFDPDDVLLLRDATGELVGSCWLKVEDGIGEFYAVAVRPGHQGQGLGGVLMRAGTARLTGRGLTTAALYVEGDNVPALALYRRSGFTRYAIDVQYAAAG